VIPQPSETIVDRPNDSTSRLRPTTEKTNPVTAGPLPGTAGW
jgi:hypothetical protein